MILTREQYLRRRQIQIEDNTFVAAEWAAPRNVTDPTVNVANAKNLLKSFKFQIFGSILFLALWFQFGVGHTFIYHAWEMRLKYPAIERAFIFSISIVTISFFVGIYAGFLQWRRRPRFMPIRGDGPPPRGLVTFPILFPIIIGLLTLAIFDIYERLKNDGLHDHTLLSPNEILIFNLAVVLLYTAFTLRTVALFAKWRKYGKPPGIAA